MNSYFEAPERVAALILVAPAILAPLTSQKRVTKGNQAKGDNQIQEDSSSNKSVGNPFFQLCSALLKFAMLVLQAIAQVVKGMVDTLCALYKKLLSAILRSAFAVVLVSFRLKNFL